MKKHLILIALLLIFVGSKSVSAQDGPQSVRDYLERGKTIVIARCISQGHVKANLEADGRMQILSALKGSEKQSEISFTTRFGLKPGTVYLLRTENEARTDRNYFRIESFADAVPLSAYEDLALVKSLPVEIQVIRIFNVRKDDLDAQIRRLTYERDALAQVLKNQ